MKKLYTLVSTSEDRIAQQAYRIALWLLVCTCFFLGVGALALSGILYIAAMAFGTACFFGFLTMGVLAVGRADIVAARRKEIKTTPHFELTIRF